MCGIIGILGKKCVASSLIAGLKRLEYRGYDSSGIATVHNGRLYRVRAEGKLVHLEEKLKKTPLKGSLGIGHTRWATHGVAVERNAHPHVTERLAIVHNGIIENFVELQKELIEEGYTFETETDTEVIAHLITRALKSGLSQQEAIRTSWKRLQGAFAIVVIFEGQDNLMIAARSGPPLAIGYGQDEFFVGSDAVALASFVDRISYMEDGDWAVLTREGVTIYGADNQPVKRPITTLFEGTLLVSKGNHRHFMHKEMFEQPEVISHNLSHYLDLGNYTVRSLKNLIDWKKINRILFASCGTAYYSTLVARYWFENFAALSVDNDIASEFRYREPPITSDVLSVFVSQSGETADTLACLRYCREHGVKTATIVNVEQSTMAREADFILPTRAGPEIGVASTKAFTCQLATLAAMALDAAKQRGSLSEKAEHQFVQQLAEVPRILNEALKLDDKIEQICRDLVNVRGVLYLGRGTSYPIALEGALKLKELSYIHAEGYAAGELKHGPIALVDEAIPVIVVAPYDRWFEKTFSNMQEVAARNGRIILITDKRGAEVAGLDTLSTIVLPNIPEFIAPIIYALPIQLIAYHTAVLLGTDVDQPRNLAKSVTVE
ncbi:glutamine--fructose-6-phosphate transaminase (isomerizing) [Bartonella quintana]|uniref:Glutamine--fructose-6-phosphate aminotransferase [isomerizing] n=1 Tax=Bartonella quintana JK 68 TaxID=1134503 RepID=A0ABR4SQF0_BARQI|nr:glutamine--fructose-6-phosphate transaminase (isomerizing) [Bartonella quintana]ETS13170.1 glucosamine-fructose-6-phosphate aminotransferase [isomerizing] [Bartonella quintana BQ2-D70]KEC62768.1 glucosamine-fructose-6-phosphate aminotransferase [isomerizing] [Bartonella quintana JK 63]KEC63374.1 glucosamine-fructose-6-phosphate aminotransferase [isomerizing] [Bartonella quintana JK 31]KEC63940.1 glucosamine-fructose-6-phosphate aminotransferase [isomerizing] [Bartonella quintana JK 56]KEC66